MTHEDFGPGTRRLLHRLDDLAPLPTDFDQLLVHERVHRRSRVRQLGLVATVAVSVTLLIGGLVMVATNGPTDTAPNASAPVVDPAVVPSAPSTSDESVSTDTTQTTESTEVAISDTIFPRPPSLTDPVVVSSDEMDAIRNNLGARQTVALERADDGTVLWWMTVWAGTTPSGTDVYCTGARAGGHTCAPDANVVLSHPVQVSAFAMEAPGALQLVTDSTVTLLRASIDGAEPVDVDLVNIGVTSGKQAAGLYLGDGLEVRFYATLNDGSSYNFGVMVPAIEGNPTATPAGPEEAFAPRELTGE